MNALKKYYKKSIRFLNEDSFLSWIANIALAFVLIRFIVYPLLGLIFATEYPIVAVVSGSMEHSGSFEEWWQSSAYIDGERVTQEEFYSHYSITREDFEDYSFPDGFNTGDIMVLRGTPPDEIERGDIIVFQSPGREPIIHRVIENNLNEGQVTFTTKGDANPVIYDFERDVPEEDVIGKAIMRIPFLGYVKIWFFAIIEFFAGVFT